MSHHVLVTNNKFGDDVRVRAGWDRPLQGFWCMVERVDDEVDEDELYIFNNLDLETPHPKSFSVFETVLGYLGIDLPDAMKREILLDQARNTGNRVCHWSPTGQITAEKR